MSTQKTPSNPIGATLLQLVSLSIGLPAQPPRLEASLWEQLFVLSVRHNVAGLVAEVVTSNETAPIEVRLKFAAMQQHAQQKYTLCCAVLSKVLSVCNNLGIRTLLLKGLAICRYYPLPSLRTFSDIDIYQFGHHRKADRQVAKVLGSNVSHNSHHHTKYLVDNVLVENHYDIVPRYGTWGNHKTERILKQEAAAGCIDYSIGGQPCLLPSPNFTALFLMRHMAIHFAAEAITVRHLVDWTLFCKSEGHIVEWKTVATRMKQMGMIDFALSIEYICNQQFGCTSYVAMATGLAAPQKTAFHVLSEILQADRRQLSATHSPLQRLHNKWQRLLASRWKHDLCYPAPWLCDLPLMLCAKLIRPHTILH